MCDRHVPSRRPVPGINGWIGRFRRRDRPTKPRAAWARRSSRQRRGCQDVGVDEAFERIRLPVVDPVSGSLVFDGSPPVRRRAAWSCCCTASRRARNVARPAARTRGGWVPRRRGRSARVFTRGPSRRRACLHVRRPRRGHAGVRGSARRRNRSSGRPRGPRLGRRRRLARRGTPSRAAAHAHGRVHAAPGRPVRGPGLRRRPGDALLLHPAVPPARQGRARAARRRRPPGAHDVRGLWPARLRRLCRRG